MDKSIKRNSYSNQAIAELLDQTNWSNDFSWRDLSVMSEYFSAYDVPKGGVIFHEGSKADDLGLVVSGSVRISKMSHLDQVMPIINIGVSQTFGELSLIDGQPRSGLAEAITNTTFVSTSRAQLLRMSSEHPDVAFRLLWKITNIISQRLRHTSFKMLAASFDVSG